jgi:hypothetical protein
MTGVHQALHMEQKGRGFLGIEELGVYGGINKS